MASWSHIEIHENLIKHTTGKAYLIHIPVQIDEDNWCVWMPGNLIRKRDITSNIVDIHYSDDFVFKLVKEDRDDKETKDLKPKEFKKLFKDYNLENEILINDLDNNISKLELLYSRLEETLIDIQTIEQLPQSIDSEINELDISDIKLLIENMILTKNRLSDES